MKSRLAIIGAAVLLSACSDSRQPSSSVCSDTLPCGYFEIARTKESSPVFFATTAPGVVYRICVEEGSVIPQTVEPDGSASALGAEIRGGNCADLSLGDKVYIIGNTASGRSTGFYYRVP